MKSRIFLKFFTSLFACLLILQVYADPINKDTNKQIEIESIIKLSLQFGKDTAAIKKYLAPIILQAKQTQDIPVLWACEMLMADTYSMLYDQTNVYSDGHYDAAKQLLNAGNYPELEFIGNLRQGYYHFIYRQISEAFPFFLQANYLEPKLNINKVPILVDHYKIIASFYSYIGNQERALEYLEMVLPFAEKASRERIDLLNSLSIYSKKLAKDEQALYYLKESLKEAETAKDSVWIGIIYGNLSEYSWQEGKVAETFDYLNKNIELSLRYNELLDAMRANLKLAQYHLALADWKSASKYVIEALALMEDKPYFLTYKVDALKCLADIAALKGDLKEELKNLKEYLHLKAQLDEQVNNEEIRKISWKFEVEKYEQALKSNEIKQKEVQKIYTLLGISIFLGAVIIILLINRSRNKIKIHNFQLEKKQLQLAYEKKIVDQELATVRNALTEFTATISENNSIISKLRKELQNTAIVDESLKNKVSEELNSMLKSHLMTQERWLDFRKEFDLVYPNHLQNLKISNPLLTENDFRIIALMKLDLNNRSMGDLLGISVEGIKKAKQRLKKKINIENIER